MSDLAALTAQSPSWIDASGGHADIALSTRIRLARNFQELPFAPRSRPSHRQEVLARVRSILPTLRTMEDPRLLELLPLTVTERQVLLERRLVSRDLLGGTRTKPVSGASLLASPGGSLSVMVNEEDHLRLQVLLSGLQLEEAWSRLDRLDDELGALLPYAVHPEFGFLTSCPTNVGTGLRASVLLHLPGLVLTKEIGKVLQGLSQVGLTFRGLYGEGSEVVGNFFQLSNQTTLGRTEEDLVAHLDRIVRRVIQFELQARRVLMRDAGAITEDKVWRAYGLLRYARALSYEEMMNLLSALRLGVSLKLLPGLRVYALNRILIFGQPAHLSEAAGRALESGEDHSHRAALVRKVLLSEGFPGGEGDGSELPPPTDGPQASPSRGTT